MDRDSVTKIKVIFLEAIELDPSEQAAYLDRVCAGEQALRARVQRLLDHDTATNAPLLDRREEAPAERIADGTVIGGRFEIVRFVGSGGMGEVYAARDRELGAVVALKTVRPGVALDERRFLREVQMARQVTHPSICRVFDLGHDGPLTFLTMELLEGETLRARLESGALPLEKAAHYARQIAAGLTALHEKGIVHRDLKPGNIMLTGGDDDRAVIMDFGLARTFEGDAELTDLTQSGHLIGTPGYIAPEQFEGKLATAASDVYCFGTVLYEMVSGNRLAGALVGGKSGLSPEWERCVLACLERDPAARPASATAALALLEPEAEPAKVPEISPARRWIALAAAAAVLGTALIAWRMSARREPAQVTEELTRATEMIRYYYRGDNLKNGAAALEQIARANPGYAPALSELCSARWTLHVVSGDARNLTAAEDACNRAVSLDPGLATPHVTLTKIHAKEGRLDLASSEVREALRLDPRNASAYHAQSTLLEAQGRAAEMEPVLQKAVDLAPEVWSYHNALGVHYMNTGKLPAAEEQMLLAIRYANDHADLYSNLGLVYRRQAKYTEAERAFRKRIEIGKPARQAFINLGSILQLQGNYPAAIEAFQKAVEIDPESHTARGNLASAYQWSGAAGKARESYLAAIALAEKSRQQLRGPDPRLIASLGAYYAAVGDAAKAIPLLRQALALSPDSADVQIRVGEGYELLHRREEALRAVHAALDLGYSPDYVNRSPELALLRSDPRFRQ